MSRIFKKSIQLLPGNIVSFNGDQYVITDILDLESVLAKNIETNVSKRLLVREITPETIEIDKKLANNLALINGKDWTEANRRFQIIKPILESGKGYRVKNVKIAADVHKVSQASIYRWIKLYEIEKRVSALVRPTRKDKGVLRTDPEVEKIIQKHIKFSYLSEQRLTPVHVHEKIKGDCRDLGLKVPHLNTIRCRITQIPDEEETLKRYGKDAARDKFKPSIGHFPGADYPLAVVQIDHTPMDIIVVDDENRLPIGRPNLTLAIDVFSKVVHGYYIGLDPAGALSTGLCISHAILPKETWLASMDITTPYPVWGKMRTIHTDNAAEFRGTMLEVACKEHHITSEKRPKGSPEHGGHIERSFRTFMHRVHTIPGTTRSNVQDKGDYDSEGHACMTLSALEKWFAIFIVEYYHQQRHKGNNGVPPIVAYERGILGNDKQPGVGLPERITDEYKLKLDFMPFKMRTVQDYGILFDDLHYYHDSLHRWINAIDPKNIKHKRKFICRYDPRNLSKLYFFEPDSETYIEVPFKDITRPPISTWELRAAKKKLLEDGYTEINEELIFQALKKMTALVESEKDKTKSARKMQARKKNWGKAAKHIPNKQSTSDVDNNTNISITDDDIFSKTIVPFNDIEEAE